MRTKKENTTFAFELANHPNRSGLYAVMLRITQERKKKRIKVSGVEVKKKDWNPKAKGYEHVRSSCSGAEKHNNTLQECINKYKEAYQGLQKDGKATPENIIALVEKGHTSESFLQYTKDVAQSIYEAGGVRNWKNYHNFENKLEGFLKSEGKSDLLFAELTPSFLRKYESYLRKLPNKQAKGQTLHPNSIAESLELCKRITNKAIKEKFMNINDNPFLSYEIKKVKTAKEKLEGDELARLQSLDLMEGSAQWHSRNYFFFSFYCAGIRVGDLMQLRWCNITPEGRLCYQMGKNHKVRDLQLVPQALAILEQYKHQVQEPTDYIFPILDKRKGWAKYVTQDEKDRMKPDLKKNLCFSIANKTATINKTLRAMAKDAGIAKKVTMYIARHSFAKAAKEAGIDNLAVKELLAHSDIATTEKYMGNFDTDRTDAAMRKVFEGKTQEETLLAQLQGVDPEILKKVLEKLNNNNN